MKYSSDICELYSDIYLFNGKNQQPLDRLIEGKQTRPRQGPVQPEAEVFILIIIFCKLNFKNG